MSELRQRGKAFGDEVAKPRRAQIGQEPDAARATPYEAELTQGHRSRAVAGFAEPTVRTSGEFVRDAYECSARLVQLSGAIADAVSADQVHRALVDQAAQVLSATRAALWTLTDDPAIASLARAVGYSDEAGRALAELRLGDGPSHPISEAVHGEKAVWIGDRAELAARYPQLHTAFASAQTGGRLVFLPLSTRERVLGVLSFTFADTIVISGPRADAVGSAPRADVVGSGPRADAVGPGPREDQRRLLLLMAHYAAQALERLRLLSAEQHARAQAEASRQRAEILHGLAAALIRAETIDVVLSATLDAVERALDTTRSAVLAFDPDGVMRFKASHGLSPEYRQAVEGHSPWTRDAVAPKPVLVPDVTRDASLAEYRGLFAREGIGALAFVPIALPGGLLGKFMVYFETARAFAPHEVEMATTIASHVAIAMERFARLNELQRSLRFSELFTGVLGHDLRNPLSAIMTGAQLALVRTEDERLTRPLRRIVASGERMARMIVQLLDFTRIRVGGGLRLDPRAMELGELVRQSLDEFEHTVPASDIRLTLTGDLRGSWDDDRLMQVFSNLVANALQHGSGGVQIALDGSTLEQVVVTVHNPGCIPAALLPKLFEPIGGGEHRRERSHGLGLGLYISAKIVRAHGGRLDVASNEASGTTFTVTLPRTTVAAAAPAPAQGFELARRPAQP